MMLRSKTSGWLLGGTWIELAPPSSARIVTAVFHVRIVVIVAWLWLTKAADANPENDTTQQNGQGDQKVPTM